MLKPPPQVVLQTERESAPFECAGFDAVPAINPAVITLVSDGSAAAQASVGVLRAAITLELDKVRAASSAACCGDDIRHCQAHGEPRRRKLVVLVGDGVTSINDTSALPTVDPKDELCALIPVFPLSARANVGSLLPKDLRLWNAEFWSENIAEAVPAILARAGLVIDRPRIFISYRQIDTAALAAQLFDALSHKNCDVFLDHFRIEAGIDFQARLTEELGDKSMFVLLESPAVLDSDWVKYEIAKATALGIGRLALKVPRGTPARQINDDTRCALTDADFEQGAYAADRGLTTPALERVTRRILREHARALFRRRASLQNSLRTALRRYGVTRADFDHFGALHVYCDPNTLLEDYVVWLSPAPPGLAEFYTAHSDGRPPAKGVVIGPTQTIAAIRHRQTSWLAARSNLVFVDEANLLPAALRMARGTL